MVAKMVFAELNPSIEIQGGLLEGAKDLERNLATRRCC